MKNRILKFVSLEDCKPAVWADKFACFWIISLPKNAIYKAVGKPDSEKRSKNSLFRLPIKGLFEDIGRFLDKCDFREVTIMNRIVIDSEKCIGCELCVKDCPGFHLHMDN